MTEALYDSLTTIPGFGSPTILPATDRLVYWYTDESEPVLQYYDHNSGTVEIVPIQGDEYAPSATDILFRREEGLVVHDPPDVYLLAHDGTVEGTCDLEDEYLVLHDVDPAAERMFYIYYPDGPGPGGAPWELRIQDRGTRDTTTLTIHPEQHGHAGFSPECRWIAFRENPDEEADHEHVVIADLDGNRERTFHVGDPASRTRLYDWHPDGRRLLLCDRSTGWYRPGLYDWRDEEAMWFGTEGQNEHPLTILPDGCRLVTARFHDGRSTVHCYPITDPSAGRELDLPDGVVNRRTRQQVGVALADGFVMVEIESSTQPPCLFGYDLETDTSELLIDTCVPELADLHLVQAEHITYESMDGRAVNAILYRAEETPSPAIVHVHGGPTTAERCTFDRYAQLLVHDGYTVLKPNYRGSTDQDQAFERALRGEMAGLVTDDIAAAGQWLAERSWIDGTRLAVHGHSAGAYIAAMQALRHPERWQVVIPENGAMDQVQVLLEPNQYARRRVIADPEVETQESYLRERSPVHRADDIGCPVCLIHGENDPGLEMSERFVERLEERGWTAGDEYRFEVFEDEGHVIGNSERLCDLLTEVCETYFQRDAVNET